MIVVVCLGPESHVYGPFEQVSDAQAFIDEGPCDNEHEIQPVIGMGSLDRAAVLRWGASDE